ncbi:MAG: hypothetical protein MI741_13150 [Rhodospirillales bacterium]|nr:hypothetical protein [Rhodospirillales bacterium]
MGKKTVANHIEAPDASEAQMLFLRYCLEDLSEQAAKNDLHMVSLLIGAAVEAISDELAMAEEMALQQMEGGIPVKPH